MSFFQSFYLWASNYTAISIQPWTHGYTKKVEVTAFLPWIGIRKIEIFSIDAWSELTDLVDEGDPPKPTPRAKGCKRVEAIGVNKSHSEMSLIHVVGDTISGVQE
ncbi:hypothetical protein ACJX0J_037251 [Zea mays]